MPTTGKMYFGSTLIAEPGMQWEYDRPYPPDYGTDYTWTIPGTLQQTFTTSGTYTPAAGVSTVNVAVIGGGGNGATPGGNNSGGGGAGGGVRVYRNVPVSGPVAVVVGGSGTGSSFGALTAPGGGTTDPYGLGAHEVGGFGKNFSTVSNGGLGYTQFMTGGSPGFDGALINGTYYAGGGGGFRNVSNQWKQLGGRGGGGNSGTFDAPGYIATNGTNGFGGGGGGTNYGAAKVGGSGRVMIWSEDV